MVQDLPGMEFVASRDITSHQGLLLHLHTLLWSVLVSASYTVRAYPADCCSSRWKHWHTTFHALSRSSHVTELSAISILHFADSSFHFAFFAFHQISFERDNGRSANATGCLCCSPSCTMWKLKTPFLWPSDRRSLSLAVPM